MIYCVVPRELEADLFARLVGYYAENPGVTVIIDRRHGPDRRNWTGAGAHAERRELRDRRRMRIPGTFPKTDLPDDL
jgi:hypothetical protein